MNWKAQMGGRVQALKRIVALLFFFAALAERASMRPGPVRPILIWTLRHVEAIALEFVMGRLRLDTPSRISGPAEAKRLASSFRALAVALEALVWGMTRSGQVHASSDIARLPSGVAEWDATPKLDSS